MNEVMHCNYDILAGWLDNQKIGTLSIDKVRGKEKAGFAYDTAWLDQHSDIMLDPELKPVAGPRYAQEGTVFSFLDDASPDKWGCSLLDALPFPANKSGILRYLTLVDDAARIGGIRVGKEGKVLSASPVQTGYGNLPGLLKETKKFERQGYKAPVSRVLVHAGAPLGGARPKVTYKGDDGQLWIAKFPSIREPVHAECWEMTAYELGKMCGLHMPEARLAKIGGEDVFLTKRFDRAGTRRIHFASAMNLTGKKDGEAASFPDIAEVIRKYGANPEKDLWELWMRIVFTIAIHNVDCHLRNHGFLLSPAGWELSPAYDMNPIIYHKGLAICIDRYHSAPDLKFAVETAGYYGVQNPMEQAERIVRIVKNNIKWLAEKYKIPGEEITYMVRILEPGWKIPEKLE